MTASRRFLIVDDEPAICEILATYVRIAGHSAALAHSAQAARDLLLHERPDVVLLDIMLPDVNGIELCRELRQHPVTADRPIIVISAYAPPLIEQALQAGADSYLSKPVKLADFRGALGRLGL
ncbi:MAG: response regulator [Anaerolinea sp.]|nr:response regulator [Anaerolinea sp.]